MITYALTSFHERLGLEARAWIELYGLVLLFFPFVASVNH